MDAINNPPTLGSITFLTGPMSGNSYSITKPIITIGREGDNDIVIAADASVSRHHAQLAWNNGTWSITKLSLQNTLLVNDRDMPQGELRDRDMVRLGANTLFRFQSGNIQKPSFVPVQEQKSLPRQPGNAQPVRSAYKGPEIAPHSSFGPPPTIEARLPGQGQPPLQGAVGSVTQRATLDAFGELVSVAPRGIPTIEVTTNTDSERHTYELVPTKQVFNIGRESSSDIVINRPTVSGLHAQILREGNQLVFVHPHPNRGKTLNGVDYKGRKIAGNEQFRHVLTHGDFFRITDEHGTFVTLTYNDGSGATQDIVPEIRPISLVGVRELTVGRLSDNTVVLNHPQVSGHHARLTQVQGGYRIIDTNSTNHVYVNGKQVKDQVLKVGDEIRIGPFKLTYTGTQLTQHDESNSIRIDALHLKKTGNKQVVLINDISIAIPPRKFIALVGGSGAGKSTLLDALNGLRPAQDGVVLYNGQNYYQNLAAFSTQLGYVPQEDIIHRDITVEHALYYAAKMRLPDDFTEKQIKQRIDEVLDDVEMRPRRDLLVSKLSGGQRKRVSIALELLANPSVFFLDEPTSGLDPGLDRKMMLLLRKLADKGRTIVLVTHATNNINACDYVCFLCRGGRLAYYGPPDEAKKFFGKTDFSEIYSALEPTEENPKIPEEAEAHFRASEDYQRYVVGPLNQGPAARYDPNARTTAIKLPKRGNPWKQFGVLSTRYLELLKNDVGNLLILFLQAPIIGLILFFLTPHATFAPTSIATCFDRNNRVVSCQQVVDFLNTPQGQQFAQQQGKSPDQVLQDNIGPNSGGDAEKTLFIMAFAAVFFGCINGIREIVKEAPVFRRERAVNLGIAPYMFSKIVILGLLCLLQSAVLVYMVNLADPIRQGIFLPPLVEIYITMALTSISGLMLGLMVSSLTTNSDQAMSLIAPILLPQVIFAGVLFPLNSVPLQILGALFAARWSMAGMGSSVGLHGDKLGVDGFSFQGTLFTSVNHSSSVPGAVAHLLLTWIVLAAMIVIFGIAIAYFLKRKDVKA